MSLHYLVKLEVLIGLVLPLGCHRKKLQNLYHFNCGSQLCRIGIELQRVVTLQVLQEKMYKILITDLNELKQRLRTEWTKLDHVVIVAAIHHWCR